MTISPLASFKGRYQLPNRNCRYFPLLIYARASFAVNLGAPSVGDPAVPRRCSEVVDPEKLPVPHPSRCGAARNHRAAVSTTAAKPSPCMEQSNHPAAGWNAHCRRVVYLSSAVQSLHACRAYCLANSSDEVLETKPAAGKPPRCRCGHRRSIFNDGAENRHMMILSASADF